MRAVLLGIVLAFLSPSASFAQGQVLFANKVVNTDGVQLLDAPLVLFGYTSALGSISAQLFLVGADSSLAPLVPISTFQPNETGTPGLAIGYFTPHVVDVPVAPGQEATFLVRAWRTSDGDVEHSYYWGSSAPFTVTVGGGAFAPANLTSLKSFSIMIAPEPSTLCLGLIGAAALFVRRRISAYVSRPFLRLEQVASALH